MSSILIWLTASAVALVTLNTDVRSHELAFIRISQAANRIEMLSDEKRPVLLAQHVNCQALEEGLATTKSPMMLERLAKEYHSLCSNRSQSVTQSPRAVVKTLICTQPVFTEEYRLKKTVDGTQARTEYVAAAIVYMYQRYCRQIDQEIAFNEQVVIGDNCTQYSGMFRGEKVYWGQCRE